MTRLATEEAEAASAAHRRWTFGVAAGALLMAGTFAAGALGVTGDAIQADGSVPEHAPAAGLKAPAPVPTVSDTDSDDAAVAAPAPDHRAPLRATSPAQASAGTPYVAAIPVSVTAAAQTGGIDQRGIAQPVASAPAQAPAPAPAVAPAQQGALGQVVTPVVDVATDVLDPVTETVGGLLSPLTAKPAPAGPALTMINPLGALVGG